MPLLLGLVLVSLFIWLSENIGTFTKTWLYPSQRLGWSMVSFEQARLMVFAADHQLHAGEPDQCAADHGRGRAQGRSASGPAKRWHRERPLHACRQGRFDCSEFSRGVIGVRSAPAKISTGEKEGAGRPDYRMP